MSGTSAKPSLRALLSLEERVMQAQLALQKISDVDPLFERRVQMLLRLTAKRDRAFSIQT